MVSPFVETDCSPCGSSLPRAVRSKVVQEPGTNLVATRARGVHRVALAKAARLFEIARAEHVETDTGPR
jgi:hypothetical protein